MTSTFEVLLPFYGALDPFKEAVRSVLSQEQGELTLLVVEDGPQGFDTAGWLKSLRDDRIRYVKNPERLGIAGTFQCALDESVADHVVFLGCDDIMLPNYLQCVRTALAQFPDADVVQPGVRIIDADGRAVTPLVDRVKATLRPRVHRPTLLANEQLSARLMHGNWTYFPSICWRSETIRQYGFRPDLPTLLDLALLTDVLVGGGRFVLSPQVAFEYRRHVASASARSAADQTRFSEEKRFHQEVAAGFTQMGWKCAAAAARLRLTSRSHAAIRRLSRS